MEASKRRKGRARGASAKVRIKRAYTKMIARTATPSLARNSGIHWRPT